MKKEKLEQVWTYLAKTWESKEITLNKVTTLDEEYTGKEQETYYLLELTNSGNYIDPNKKFEKYPGVEEIKLTIENLIIEYGKSTDDIELNHEKEVFDYFGLSDNIRTDLHKHGIDYERTEKEWLFRLDRKWIGNNDLNIEIIKKWYNMYDDHWLVNLKGITQENFEEEVLDIDNFLNLMEQAELRVKVINESFENTFVLSRISDKDKKLRSLFNSISRWRAISNVKKIKKYIDSLENILDIAEAHHKESVIQALKNKKAWLWTVEIPMGFWWDYDEQIINWKFTIDGDTLHLDTTWSHPGTDKYFTIPFSELEEDWSLADYKLEEYKNNLMIEYRNEVAKEKKDHTNDSW